MQQLNRQDIIRIIEGKGAAERVPLLYHLWIYENMFDDDCQKRQDWLTQNPCDVDHIPAVSGHNGRAEGGSFLFLGSAGGEKYGGEGPGQPVPDSGLGG